MAHGSGELESGLTVRRIAILHHPHNQLAAERAEMFAREVSRRGASAICGDVWADDSPDFVCDADLIVTVGGDGSVLRAAHLVMGSNIPILGVNMGRLGFLTDIGPERLTDLVGPILRGEWRVERRIMVRAALVGGHGEHVVYHGLNDAVIGHASPARPVYVEVRIDGARVSVYRCDGIIVATPTGSTGYSLAAGGPIMAPTENYMVMTPVSAHLALGRSLVLLPQSVVELRVTSEHGAVLTVDGQEEVSMLEGATATITVSEHVTTFARFDSPASFYTELARKLASQSWEFSNHGD
jgi:NAD+ kinase